MPLCIKKEAFFLNEWNKQRLIEPLYELYETTQKQYWTSQSSRGYFNKKKAQQTKNGRKGRRTLWYLIHSQFLELIVFFKSFLSMLKHCETH